ncbi:MAG TPA: UPF0182 family protein [Candidatus Saccharimonadales bacterium]|nr:UPF0182 family protein [Candidatus Saccharimonadales bacterium]
MRDLFDEFMDELRRRQAGEQPGAAVGARHDAGSKPASPDGPDATDAPSPTTGRDDEAGSSGDSAGSSGDSVSDDATTQHPEAADPADEGDETEERPAPVSIQRPGRRGGRRGGGGRGGGGRGTGGPNDGAGRVDGLRGAGRRIGLIAVVVVVLLFVALAGTGLNLWTDAIWFGSVGFESVFWTRLGAQVGLFLGTGVVALAFLLFNVWLAGRLSPPPDPSRAGSIQGFLDRLASAGASFDDRTQFGGAGDQGSWRGRDRYRGPFNGPGARDDSPGGRSAGPGQGPRPGLGTSGRGAAGASDELPDLTPIGFWVIVGFVVLLAFGLASLVSGRWETILLWQNAVSFGTDPANPVTDPVFHRDVGFYLFQLPFLRLVQSVVNGLLLTGLVVAIARYALAASRGGFTLTTALRVHLAILAGLYLVSIAAGYQLDKFELVYSTQGVAAGVSYTDFNARFLAFDVLTVVAALAGALLVGFAFTRLVWPLGLAVGAWLLAAFLLGGVYPQFVQRFTVVPNQFAEEQPYIANNIAMTRLAYDIGSWDVRDYSGAAPLTQATVNAEQATFQNARLWSTVPLGATLDQIQTVRQYYDFTNVDTDRYVLDGITRQVMLSARELDQERSDASSWVNQRLTYTHGVGLAMVPVNEVTPDGLPNLLIRDLPPVSSGGAPTVTQPRIYFGERPSNYVIVDAKQPEFDYPAGGTASTSGDQGTQTSWTAKTGISLDSTLTRLLFAARLGDLNLLISDQITPNSQLLMTRSLGDRLQQIAPFLQYDSDPYLVVGSDGGLYYIQDAYTVSNRFPNAQPVDPSLIPAASGLTGTSFNYIRNSVKIVMNAYDGTMTFYAADPSDPILRAYEGVFPSLFKPLASMPADLRAHLRVPEDLFDIQTRMYATYHVTDPETFYRKTDLWTVPTSSSSDQTLPSEAYYVEMRMPGEANAEFLLLQPMVPAQRPNMIAWIAARNDAPNYGSVRVYRFPQDTSVRGPTQIEAQIDVEPAISSQISLWDQAGSKVVRGNLIVVPVQDSVIYLEPIYLQSTSSAFPAFQKIVVATSTKVVWGNTLSDALQQLLAGGTSPTPTPGSSGAASPAPSGGPGTTPSPTATTSAGPIPTPPAGDLAGLIAYANLHFNLAQDALRAGDFTRYGQEIAVVRQALQLLDQLVPVGSPTPLPLGTPIASPPPNGSPSPTP